MPSAITALSAIIVPVLAVCIAYYIVAAGPLNSCSSSQFTCKDGGCINGTLKCDGVKHCPDGSDEIFIACYNTTCDYDTQFRCNYGGCVDTDKQCNDEYDCWDKSDENKFLCAVDEDLDNFINNLRGDCSSSYALQCNDGEKCLMWSQVCNGESDCPNGYDESADICGSSICPDNSFRCESGACISLDKFCNRNIDCADGSDEIPAICLKETMAEDVKIAHADQAEEEEKNKWITNSCPLTRKPGMHVEDYFSEFSFRPDAQVPDKTIVSVNCDSGYAIFGSNINKCENNEWLSEWALCLRMCDQNAYVRNVSYSTQCFSNNALVDCQQNTQILDTELRVTCAPGYKANSGSDRMGRHICNEHGNWTVATPNPICEPVCGVKSPQHPDIIPWTVSVFKRISNNSDYSFKCLGTILSSKIAITAGDCFTEKDPSHARLNYSIAEGNHNVQFKLDEDHGYVLHNILHINIYDRTMYALKKNGESKKQYTDALLILVQPFRFGALLRPICLTAQQANSEDDHTLITEALPNQQLGEGVTHFDQNRYTLTHIVASESKKFNIDGLVNQIGREIAKSELDP